MGFQFLHIEAYARHGSSSTASRANGRRERSPPRPCASLTPAPVAQPLPPQVLHGCTRQRPRSWPTTGPTAARTPRGASCAPMASPWRLGWCPCPRSSARTGPGSVRRQWRGFGSSTASGCARWWSTQTRRTPSALLRRASAGSGSVLHPGRQAAAEKGPPRGQKGRTERRIQAGYGGVAGWLSKGRSGPFGLTRRGPRSGG